MIILKHKGSIEYMIIQVIYNQQMKNIAWALFYSFQKAFYLAATRTPVTGTCYLIHRQLSMISFHALLPVGRRHADLTPLKSQDF